MCHHTSNPRTPLHCIPATRFQLGAVPAGGSTSCLIRARFRAGGQSGGQPIGSQSAHVGLHLLGDWVELANNGRDIDPNPSNDDAEFMFMGGLAGIPMSRGAMLLLGVLLVPVGSAILR